MQGFAIVTKITLNSQFFYMTAKTLLSVDTKIFVPQVYDLNKEHSYL